MCPKFYFQIGKIYIKEGEVPRGLKYIEMAEKNWIDILENNTNPNLFKLHLSNFKLNFLKGKKSLA